MRHATYKNWTCRRQNTGSFAGIADLLHVLKHLKFALNVAFFVRHEYFLHSKSGNLQEVS